MKRFAAVLALTGMVAVPAMAGVSAPLPVGTVVQEAVYDVGMGGVRSGIVVYSDLTVSGFYLNAGSGATYPGPVGDDIHATSGGTITEFKLGYNNAGTGTTFDLDVAFYGNDPTDTLVPPPAPGTAPLLGSYTLTGLPVGAYILTVTGVSVPVGADFWFEADYGTADVDVGPIITGDPGGAVGFSHDLYSQDGFTWDLGGSPWADFVHEFSIVPEPAMISMLVVGGLLALGRRRRQS
ncbi:MAG: PEP-CTERM sorting domain-containing protein [Phycisphaerales bacterium]|nr:MAG: PEP-CTERM sorting domain-containing protein [Phycisphaerales bacterium]